VRVRWITAEPPDRDLGGGNIRQAHLIEAVASRAETHLLLAGSLRDEVVRRAVAGVTEVTATQARTAPQGIVTRRAFEVRMALGTRQPEEVFLNQPVRAALRDAIGGMPEADVVVLEHAALAHLVPSRRESAWTLSLQNVPSLTAAQALPLQRGRRQRWLVERERAKALRFETWAASAFDTVFCVSPLDASSMGPSAVVIPNGVDLERFRRSPVPDSFDVVFTGSLNFLPNVDGLEWFCGDVWEGVRALVPAATFHVVGRDVIPRVEALARRPGVEIHVDVESVVPYLERAHVVVVPLRMGSGTRLKALEALAVGRPVVGTSIGLAGLGIRANEHALVADSAQEFAAAVVGVLRNERPVDGLVESGRRLAESFSWSRVADTFCTALLDARERHLVTAARRKDASR
jgi:glycosyltransferase involved in cell wall biosynthesis